MSQMCHTVSVCLHVFQAASIAITDVCPASVAATIFANNYTGTVESHNTDCQLVILEEFFNCIKLILSIGLDVNLFQMVDWKMWWWGLRLENDESRDHMRKGMPLFRLPSPELFERVDISALFFCSGTDIWISDIIWKISEPLRLDKSLPFPKRQLGCSTEFGCQRISSSHTYQIIWHLIQMPKITV